MVFICALFIVPFVFVVFLLVCLASLFVLISSFTTFTAYLHMYTHVRVKHGNKHYSNKRVDFVRTRIYNLEPMEGEQLLSSPTEKHSWITKDQLFWKFYYKTDLGHWMWLFGMFLWLDFLGFSLKSGMMHWMAFGKNSAPITLNTPFTQGLRPLCLPCVTTKLARLPLKAEGRPNGCLGRSRVAHRTFRHRHGRHGHHEVLSMLKTVAQRSPRRSVAHRSLKGDRMKAHIALVAEWMHNGRSLVAQRKMRTLCINLSDTSAFLVPPLCLLWPTNGIHWAITVATTEPPFSHHGNTWATMAMDLPSLCLLCATCCATTAALVVQGRHTGRAVAVTQKQNFLGSGDHWAS